MPPSDGETALVKAKLDTIAVNDTYVFTFDPNGTRILKAWK